jgi:hypothetical protein
MNNSTSNSIPNYAGFVPSLRYQFGETYGNATRHILETDPTLKSGKIQRAVQAKSVPLNAPAPAARSQESVNGKSKEYTWRLKNKYQTGDDRATFPPVPGYVNSFSNFLVTLDLFLEATNTLVARMSRPQRNPYQTSRNSVFNPHTPRK